MASRKVQCRSLSLSGLVKGNLDGVSGKKRNAKGSLGFSHWVNWRSRKCSCHCWGMCAAFGLGREVVNSSISKGWLGFGFYPLWMRHGPSTVLKATSAVG